MLSFDSGCYQETQLILSETIYMTKKTGSQLDFFIHKEPRAGEKILVNSIEILFTNKFIQREKDFKCKWFVFQDFFCSSFIMLHILGKQPINVCDSIMSFKIRMKYENNILSFSDKIDPPFLINAMVNFKISIIMPEKIGYNQATELFDENASMTVILRGLRKTLL